MVESPFSQPVQGLLDQMRMMSPSIVRQLLPLVEQLQQMYMDMARGTREFIPAPDETHRIIQAYYRVPRNMLIRFRDDSIDESTDLASMLSSRSPVSGTLDLAMKIMPGGHGRPLAQSLVEVPPQVSQGPANPDPACEPTKSMLHGLCLMTTQALTQ